MSNVKDSTLRKWLLVVLGAAVLTRLGLWLVYPLTTDNDSLTYLQLAKNLVNKGFATYNATRTPGYPAFLALAGEHVYLAQLVAGVLTTLLFFYIGWRLSGKAWFGGLVALAHTLNLGQLMYEGALLTEEMSTFWLVLSLAGVVYLFTSDRTDWLPLLAAFLSGLAAFASAMTRPLFVFVPFLFALFFFLHKTRPLRWRLGLALAVALPAALLFGAWINYIHANYKIWSLDTIGGYRMLNHTGVFFEYVPDRYAALRDTYLKYRDAKIAATGSQTNAAWDAVPAMQRVTKLGYFGLSRLLEDISIQLILAHPDLYLKNVVSGWWAFWWVGVYWSPESVHPAALTPFLDAILLVERGVAFLSNLVFILGSLAVLVSKRVRAWLRPDVFLWLLLGIVWASSIVQTLLDHGDNPRYLVPLQSLVILVVLGWLAQLYGRWDRWKTNEAD